MVLSVKSMYFFQVICVFGMLSQSLVCRLGNTPRHSFFTSPFRTCNSSRHLWRPSSESSTRFLCTSNKLSETEIRRKRCLFHSRERGMHENDLLLGTFADKYLNTLSDPLLKQYEELLQVSSSSSQGQSITHLLQRRWILISSTGSVGRKSLLRNSIMK